MTGCAGSAVLNIPPQFTLNPKTQNSIVLGKIVFEGIAPGFGELLFVVQDTAIEKDYFLKLAPPQIRDNDAGDARRVDYHYFVELPAGHYSIREIAATHSKFEIVEAYLLHANFTIPQSSIVYIGTIKVKNIKSSLNLLAPITENEIVDERSEVTKIFKENYPQFQGQRVETKLIDEYEFFKEGGIGGKF